MWAGNVNTLEGWVHSCVDPYVDSVRRIERAEKEGVSADFALCRVLQQADGFRERMQAYIIPCVRKETASRIEVGTHLTLFFLFVLVGGPSFSTRPMDNLLCNLGLLSRALPSEIRIQLRSAHFRPARNFPFSGSGVEMVSGNVELARLLKVFDLSGRHIANLLGIGIERLLMHSCTQRDVWQTPPFRPLAGMGPRVVLDKMRKEAFFLRACSDTPAVEMTLLRGFSAQT